MFIVQKSSFDLGYLAGIAFSDVQIITVTDSITLNRRSIPSDHTLIPVISPCLFQFPKRSYRKIYFPHLPSNLITPKFILGLPAPVEHYNPAAAIARAKVMRMIEEESEREGDMVILDVSFGFLWE